GAISIVTRRPAQVFEGRTRLRIGNDERRYADGMLNLPVSDSMAFRLNVLHDQSGGWLEDAATGKALNGGHNSAVRLAFGWDIGDATRAVLSVDREKMHLRSRPTIGIVDLDPASGLPEFPANPAHYHDPFDMPAYTDVAGNDEIRDFDGATLQVEHDFDWGRLTSTTAWRAFDTLNRAEEDATNRANLFIDTTNIEHNKTWYQEFKFSGSTTRLDWVAGASWFKEQARQSSVVDLTSDSVDTASAYVLGVPLFSTLQAVAEMYGVPVQLFGHPWQESYDNTLDASAYAAFGDVIWHATDRLNLTFGLRYTRDEKDFSWLNTQRNAPTLAATLDQLEAIGIFALAGIPKETFVFNVAFIDPPATRQKGVLNKASQSWTDLSPRFVVDYHFNDNTMGYASLAKGYKAGGFNSLQIDSEFDNEDVWNFETGIKQAFPDLRLQYNASAFYYVYDNRQAVRLDMTTAIPRYVVDTSDLEAFGVDFDTRWQVTDGLALDFNASYIDSTYKDYVTPEGVDVSGQPTGIPDRKSTR